MWYNDDEKFSDVEFKEFRMLSEQELFFALEDIVKSNMKYVFGWINPYNYRIELKEDECKIAALELSDGKKYLQVRLPLKIKQIKAENLFQKLSIQKLDEYSMSIYVNPFESWISVDGIRYISINKEMTETLHKFMQSKFGKVWVEAYNNYLKLSKEIKITMLNLRHAEEIEKTEEEYDKKMIEM